MLLTMQINLPVWFATGKVLETSDLRKFPESKTLDSFCRLPQRKIPFA